MNISTRIKNTNNKTSSTTIHPINQPILEIERGTYWNSFYESTTKKRNTPSQFAVFVANELPFFDWVIDLGCGNGRDSLFFHDAGYGVLAVDGSETAISKSKELIQKSQYKDVSTDFYCEKINQLTHNDIFTTKSKNLSKIIYSRFFLHAITETEEDAFLELCTEISTSGDVLALEFRTKQDEGRAKVTASHYRRFIEPTVLIDKIIANGCWKVIYTAEGTGFAKYNEDDAHVCRILLIFSDGASQ
jgi:SAM-dependent methyltransferase